jgi:hypothetical protein
MRADLADPWRHRRSGPHEGGVWLRITRPMFLWRCGCLCHRDPERIGLLF